MLELGFVYSHQHNGDLVRIPVSIPGAPDATTPIAFDSDGVEVYARVGVKKFGLIGGFTEQLPYDKDPALNPDFRTRYLISGTTFLGASVTSRQFAEEFAMPCNGAMFDENAGGTATGRLIQRT